MSALEILKSTSRRASHSVLHNLTLLALPFRPEPAARAEIWGGVTVVSLSAGLLILMRCLLAD
jgi:hypothetical protein